MEAVKTNTEKYAKWTAIFGAFFLAFFALTAQAVEIAPEDLPTGIDEAELVITEKVETGDVADDLFPEVDVENPTKPSGELKEELFTNRFIGDERVIISEDVDHDLFIGANTVRTEATLGNDLFAAASDINVDGVVEGSVRLAGGKVVIEGIVKKNALIFAEVVIIEESAIIMGDVFIAGAEVHVEGTVEGTTELYGQFVTINGEMHGQVKTEAESILIEKKAVLHAPVAAIAPTFSMSEGATGTTFVQHTERSVTERINDYYGHPDGLAALTQWITSFFFFAAIGILLILFWPEWQKKIVSTMEKETGRTWERGIVFFFVGPIILTMIALTVIGVPFALIGGVSYVFLLLLGRIMVGMWLGKHLVHHKFSKDKKNQQMAEFIAGFFIVSVLYSLPWIGWLIGIIAGIWGAGAVKHVVLGERAKKKKKKRKK